MKLLYAVLLIVFSTLVVYCNGSANARVSNTSIVDDAGRVRLYHGVNFVMKGFPWYPPELLDPNVVDTLAQWGINFVRLGYSVFLF